MSFRKTISSLPILRPTVIHLLELMKRDIRIRNPWTKDWIYLNSYYHKGYWFFGKERENPTMRMFANYIGLGATVVEIGGHIGFISQYFAKAVGIGGRVIVFEPGRNNLPYIRRNTRKMGNVTIEEIAISNCNSKATFYEDNITGQNNSLLPHYKNADDVAKTHRVKLIKTEFEVDVSTLDAYVCARNLTIDFIKIDIEGNELNALIGATETLKRVNALMVEVTENHREVSDLLLGSGFTLYNEHGEQFSSISFSGNVFAIRRPVRHGLVARSIH